VDIDEVINERELRYGGFDHNARVSQLLKNCIKECIKERTNNKPLRVTQLESLDMICFKIARIINGDPDYADNWVDIAGYATLVANRLNKSE
jgi:hypothetical protein